MERSETITALAAALLEFNSEVQKIDKDRKNEFVGNMYATLDNIIENIRPILTKHGLSVMQLSGGNSSEITIQTMLLHKSGEWMMSPLMSIKPVKDNPQAAGSALTYLRRYSLNAFLSLNTGDDDDANKATEPDTQPTQTPTPHKSRSAAPGASPSPQTNERPAQSPRSSGGQEKAASESQLKAIKSIARSKWKDETWIEEQCRKKFQKALSELARSEASTMIDALRAWTPQST